MLVTVLQARRFQPFRSLYERRVPTLKRCHQHRNSVTNIQKSSPTLSYQQNCHRFSFFFSCDLSIRLWNVFLACFDDDVLGDARPGNWGCWSNPYLGRVLECPGSECTTVVDVEQLDEDGQESNFIYSVSRSCKSKKITEWAFWTDQKMT